MNAERERIARLTLDACRDAQPHRKWWISTADGHPTCLDVSAINRVLKVTMWRTMRPSTIRARGWGCAVLIQPPTGGPGWIGRASALTIDAAQSNAITAAYESINRGDAPAW